MKTESKIITIIRHEYTTKVKSKGFIISTMLGPIGFIVFMGVIALIGYLSADSTERKIAVLDRTNIIGEKIVDTDTSLFFVTHKTELELRDQVLSEELDSYLVIPQGILKDGEATIFSRGGGGVGYFNSLRQSVSRIVRRERLIEAGADSNLIQLVESRVDIEARILTEEGTEDDNTAILTGVGYGLGMMVYFMMLLYGSLVMRGVIEEKANRIVEVIASSATPFQIMMGKVVGIGAVGLTQVLVWMIFAAIGLVFGGSVVDMYSTSGMTPEQAAMVSKFQMPDISPWIFVGFLFYFLTGYFVYATLYAGVGSAVDQESDAGQLAMPITMLIIIPIMFLSLVIANPDGMVATVLSLIPFFTPMLMIVRIAATEVPVWQIALSVVLMISTFIACVKIAAKIYRVGILMYGKKPSLKEIFKWIKNGN
ncbi:MAG: ABC transporter permease [Candidatus Kapabacteria bacterium]|jgi:ABC-2 type transport system permease protein|nr:ABC transporter permease [Candidatus Kapabacteria bacterium]